MAERLDFYNLKVTMCKMPRQKNTKELANKIVEILTNRFEKPTETSAPKFIKDRFDWKIISDRYRKVLNRLFEP